MLIELHELLLVGLGGVAHSERDAAVFDAADARVRDRDAIRVMASITEFITRKLKLRINQAKSRVAPALGLGT